jgi:hypothetical protein
MSRYELANEGCTPPAGEAAFNKYNTLLHKEPDQLTHAIAFLALNQEVPEPYETAGKVVTEVLDTTNHGTQIGIGPDTETGWAHVFDDETHREVRTAHNEHERTVSEISEQLERARRELESLSDSRDSQQYEEAEQLVLGLEQILKTAQAELIVKRRLRGMQTLRVIAQLGGASEVHADLPLAA